VFDSSDCAADGATELGAKSRFTAEQIIEQIKGLIQQARQEQQQGKLGEAIKTWQQVLVITRPLKIRELEALALTSIGSNYNRISQAQEALKYYNQALPIWREVGNRSGEVTTLNNIGLVYDRISQPQEALKYYNQALPISEKWAIALGKLLL
jgi:tetratricopeptide (TPR) repeat protein